MTFLRRTGMALAVLALAVGAALVWRRWPGGPPMPGSRTAPGTGSPVVTPAPVAEIILQVNGLESARVTAGTSVFFTVSLIGNTSTGPRLGAPGRPWTTGLRFETADTGRPLPWTIDRLGPAITLQLDRDSGNPAANSQERAEQSDVAVVDAARIHRVELGVGPDQVGRIPAGTHTIRAVLPLDGGSKGESRLVSNTVTLIVEAPQAGSQQTAAAEKARLEATARFYLRSEKWEDAHRVALQLVERESPDTAAFMLLGDALNGLRRDEEALAAYQEALAELPKTEDESPDYLIARMAQVEQRLDAAKRGIKKQ